MVGLAAIQFDVDGAVLLTRAATSQIGELSRRVSRTATLDGSAVLTDLGYTDADRTLKIVERNVSLTVWDAVGALLQNYSTILISCREGVFEAALERRSYQDGNMVLTALVTTKKSV